jgi:hypothetical protein
VRKRIFGASLFDCGDDNAWWGGPTREPFALVQLADVRPEDRVRPDGTARPVATDHTALYLPGRDHPPSSTPHAVRVFSGSVWLSAAAVARYRADGVVRDASDDVLLDDDPTTLAHRLR